MWPVSKLETMECLELLDANYPYFKAREAAVNGLKSLHDKYLAKYLPQRVQVRFLNHST